MSLIPKTLKINVFKISPRKLFLAGHGHRPTYPWVRGVLKGGGHSTEGVLPVRGRTLQNPGQLAVTIKLQARCPKSGITGQLASLSYSGGERFGKRVGRHN